MDHGNTLPERRKCSLCRTSDKSKREFQNTLDKELGGLVDEPDAKLLLARGVDLLRDGPAGDRARRGLAIAERLSFGASRGLLGWRFRVREDSERDYLLFLASAATMTDTGDAEHVHEKVNDYTETLTGLVRRENYAEIWTSEIARLVRRAEPGWKIFNAVAEIGGVFHIAALGKVDPRTERGRRDWQEETALAERERNRIVRRNFTGELNRLKRGLYPRPEHSAPCGYQFTREPSGNSVVVLTGEMEPVPEPGAGHAVRETADVVRDLVRSWAEGQAPIKIARELGPRGLRARGSTEWTQGLRVHELADPGTAVTKAMSVENLEIMWKGEKQAVWENRLPEFSNDGWDGGHLPDDDGKFRYVVRFHPPEFMWFGTKEENDRLFQKAIERSRTPSKYHTHEAGVPGSEQPRYALSGLEWSEDGTPRKVIATGGNYSVKKPEARDDERSGWRHPTEVMACDQKELETSIADMIRCAARGVADARLVPERAVPAANGPTPAVLLEEAARTDEQAHAHEQEAQAFALALESNPAVPVADRLKDMKEKAEQTAAELRIRANSLRAQALGPGYPPAEQEGPGGYVFTQLATIEAGLRRAWADRAPAGLNRAIVTVFGGSFRTEFVDALEMRWQATLSFSDLDGRAHNVAVSGQVRQQSGRGGKAESVNKQARIAAAARRVLLRNQPMKEVADLAGWRTTTLRAHLFRYLKASLSSRGVPSTDLIAAMLASDGRGHSPVECPEVVMRALWSYLQPTDCDPELSSEFVKAIGTCFSQGMHWHGSWYGTEQLPEVRRAAIEVLSENGGRPMTVIALQRELRRRGLTIPETGISRISRPWSAEGQARVNSVLHHPSLERARWTAGRGASKNTVSCIPCPWCSSPDRPVWATEVRRTPEVAVFGAGVICGTCRRPVPHNEADLERAEAVRIPY